MAKSKQINNLLVLDVINLDELLRNLWRSGLFNAQVFLDHTYIRAAFALSLHFIQLACKKVPR